MRGSHRIFWARDPRAVSRVVHARIRGASLAAALVLGALALGGCGAVGEMTATDSYRSAQEFVRTSEAARAELGDIQSFSPVPTAVDFDPLGGTARLDFDVTGTRGTGTVRVELANEGERWGVRSAELAGPSGARIPLGQRAERERELSRPRPRGDGSTAAFAP